MEPVEEPDYDGELPFAVICVLGPDGHEDVEIWPDGMMSLVLRLGNGLEGDTRYTGNNDEAVKLARGLIVGTGRCFAIDVPGDAPMYRPGDECYRQPGGERAFLAPVPTGVEHRRQVRRLSSLDLATQSTWPFAHRFDGMKSTSDALVVGICEFPNASQGDSKSSRQPTYNYGRTNRRLQEESRLVLEPFGRPDGTPAVAVVVRERWEDHVACWAPGESTAELERVVTRINEGIASAWERYRRAKAAAASDAPSAPRRSVLDRLGAVFGRRAKK